jgi:hypothetical protein
MKLKFPLLLGAILLLNLPVVRAQKYISVQRGQLQTIKKAHRNGRVTGNEYRKLMNEQDVIRRTIEKAQYDGVVTAKERNAIAGKQDRAARRLRRYRTNNERY